MKKIFLGFLCFCMMSVSLFADMSKEELQQMYLDFFKSQDIWAEIEDDVGIAFEYGKYLNKMLYFIHIEKDPKLFRIAKYLGYPLDTIEKKIIAPGVMAVATGKVSYAKITYYDEEKNDIQVNAEVYLVSPDDFKDAFYELMGSIEYALHQFVTLME